MWGIVREVVIYSFFLWILLVISFRQRNGDTFLYKHTMERVFIKNNETDIDFEKVGLSVLTSVKRIYLIVFM